MAKKYTRYFLPIFLLLLLKSSPGHATHLMGADLSYECMGGGNYKFILLSSTLGS